MTKWLALLLAWFALAPQVAAAQEAGRTITIIVPYSPGTGIDILARAIGAELAKRWQQPVIVDNRVGASGNVGSQAAARAAPDGLTVLLIAKPFATNAGLFKNLPYDPVKSFTPIVKVAAGYIVLAVNSALPVKSVPEFIKYLKERPGQVNYGSAGFGTPHHLSMELFKQSTGTDLLHVPYKGTSGLTADLIGNHVSAVFLPFHVALPMYQQNQVRILGVTNPTRIPAAPEIPTFAEQGTDLEVDSWYGLLAPAGTPDAVVARYNKEINDILREPELIDTLAKQGLNTAGGPSAVLGDLIARDYVKWKKVIEAAGIVPE